MKRTNQTNSHLAIHIHAGPTHVPIKFNGTIYPLFIT